MPDDKKKKRETHVPDVDIEAAAEEMDAPSQIEPPAEGATEQSQQGEADGGNPLRQLQEMLLMDSRAPLMPRRSKKEEANAFFAFTQRLSQEFNPGPGADPVVEPPRTHSSSPEEADTSHVESREEAKRASADAKRPEKQPDRDRRRH